MIKRIISVSLILILLFSFAACGSKKSGEIKEKFSVDLNVPGKKVAIMVAAKEQYPEDYAAAAAMAEKYPDNVVVVEYGDTRGVTQNMDIVSKSEEIASNADIGAVVYSRATPYTYTALEKLKSVNPGIYAVAVEPEQSLEKVYTGCELVLTADWEKYTKDIVETASKMKAEYFVFYSYERHIANNPNYARIKRYLAEECQNKNINYIFETISDSMSVGVSAAQYAVKASVVNLFDNKKITGKNIVLFSTDASVQPTLVETARQYGLMYICPSFPTAYNGICEYYEVSVPENIYDTGAFRDSLCRVIAGDNAEGAQYAMYTFNLASVLIRASVYIAFDMISEGLENEELMERAAIRLKDASGEKKFTADKYIGADNVIDCYAPGFEILDFEDYTTES